MQFLVRAALIGSPTAVIQAAVPDLQEELDARTYLKSPSVSWDSETHQVIVEGEDEAPTPRSASGGVYDEVFEAACAVLGDFDFIRVKILDAVAIPHAGDSAG